MSGVCVSGDWVSSVYVSGSWRVVVERVVIWVSGVWASLV